MPLDEYDTILSEMLAEMTALLGAGLDSARGGQEFSTEERFIILSNRVKEMASARPDTRPIERRIDGRKRVISARDMVFETRKERHTKEKAAKR